MKKNLFIYVCLFLVMGLTVTSCKDDEPTYPIVGKTYDLAQIEVKDEVPVSRPDIIVWESTNGIVTAEGQDPAKVIDVFNLILVSKQIEGADNYMDALLNSLRHVSFLEDGNIQAEYCENLTTEKGKWKKSPLGVATYKVLSNNKMRLFLNLDAIQKTNRSVESALAVLTPIIEDVLTNGILLTYHLEGDKLSVYLDKEYLLPILKKLKPILEDKEIVDLVKGMASSAMPGNEPIINPLIEAIFRDLPGVIDGTTDLKLGLNLVEKK